METQLTERLEILLKTKPFEALNNEEKQYVLALITEAEYREYAVFFQQLSTTIESEKEFLKVSPSVLPKLQQALQNKQAVKTNKIYYRSIAASFLLGIGIYAFYQLNQTNETDYYLSDEEFNKYTQFDYTAYYVEVEDDDITEELMNMEFTP